MTVGSKARRVLALVLLTVLTAAGAALQGRQGTPITFVHATDLHLLVDNVDTPLVRRQRDLNKQIVTDLFIWVSQHRASENIRGVIITGDFDADPCWLRPRPPGEQDRQKPIATAECVKPSDPTWRNEQIARIASLLAASPIPNIYIVPGNNDIANEAASDDALNYFNDLMKDVQTKAAETNPAIRIVNFGLCFAGTDDASCISDVADTAYRLIPLPSYSFKNRGAGVLAANTPGQEKQMERFGKLVADAANAGRKPVIVTHTPEIDDPYAIAIDRYQGIDPKKISDATDLSKWSTWDLSKKALDGWKDLIATNKVSAIVAGHLHDSHREIYRPPYAWASQSAHRDLRKLHLSPPLAVKNQDNSPVQARGFALLRFDTDEVRSDLYWYEDSTHTFTADASDRNTPEQSRLSFWRKCLNDAWHYLCPANLSQVAVVLIAFLAAFLTVVRVWQIPPPEDPLARQGAAAAAAEPVFDPSPFASNFGKTVIYGLGGLIAETVLKAFSGSAPKDEDRHLYIAWFILLFFLFLITSAFGRSFVEMIRARLTLLYQPVRRQPGPGDTFMYRLAYWTRRFLGWLKSWQGPLLTFLDTFVSSVLGKNQSRTRQFTQVVVDQHRNVLRVADVVRQRITRTIEEALRREKIEVAGGDVGVNISVLSPDGESVHYIVRAPGSGMKRFGRRSVAWVSVVTGRIRWFLESLRTVKEKELDSYRTIVLFDNSANLIAGEEKTILLASHYQERAQGYQAFVVFPLPWPPRSIDGPHAKGAIHILFKSEEMFRSLWNLPPLTPTGSGSDVTYTQEDLMLADPGPAYQGAGIRSPELRAVLLDALAVLGEALRGFNENLYRAAGGSDQLL